MREIRWAVLGTGVIANEMEAALEKNGKKLAYVGLITTGVKDQMKEIAVVIFGYGTYGDQGYKIYHLFAEQYVKP